uniref:Interleukin-22 receptor subunit alpha-1-like n=1 Tax=Lepisosteus oculatus TaxID=7918 RepID=W5MEH8_LEPOC|nr:PREDICTED: interleukin-22 receptor subunit alpha-1-like [Lepisosteus oculatus]
MMGSFFLCFETMGLILAFIPLLFCPGLLASENSSQQTAYFDSRNFRNILRWERFGGPDEIVFYSVQYNIYGTPWRDKIECQNITVLFCDLTYETNIYDEYYHARVNVGGKEISKTLRFHPKGDTLLGPPEVHVSSTSSSIILKVIPPSIPVNNTLNEKHDSFTYLVNITHPPSAKRVLEQSSEQFKIEFLKNDTEYCGSVTYSRFNKMHSESSPFCTKTLRESTSTWSPIFLLPIVLSMGVIIAIVAVLSWQYVRRKGSLPNSLKLPGKLPTPALWLSESHGFVQEFEINPCQLFMVKQADTKPPNSWASLPVAQGNPNPYPPQESWETKPPGCSPLYMSQNREPPRNLDSTRSSTTSYGLVVDLKPDLATKENMSIRDLRICANPAEESELNHCAVPDGNQGEEKRPVYFKNNERECLPAHRTQASEPSISYQAGPLILPAMRVGGILTLPSLFLSLTQDDQEVDTSFGGQSCREDRPLLLDLRIDSEDSWIEPVASEEEGEKKYLPVQFPAPCTQEQTLCCYLPPIHSQTAGQTPAVSDCSSGYKQNWTPQQTQSLPSSQLERPEKDDFTIPSFIKTETREGGDFLKNWCIQIHEGKD